MVDVSQISRNFAFAETNNGPVEAAVIHKWIDDESVYLLGNGRVQNIANIRNKWLFGIFCTFFIVTLF